MPGKERRTSKKVKPGFFEGRAKNYSGQNPSTRVCFCKFLSANFKGISNRYVVKTFGPIADKVLESSLVSWHSTLPGF
jgi:hypothetical protein